jgi:hypothetical protein
MGGTSYTINPLDTLRIIAASSIFGEPQYYRDGLETPKNIDSLREYSIFGNLFEDDKSAVEIFESSIDEALTYDFKATLDFALELRAEYHMRLNPAVIFVRASQHENRVSFNELCSRINLKLSFLLSLKEPGQKDWRNLVDTN